MIQPWPDFEINSVNLHKILINGIIQKRYESIQHFQHEVPKMPGREFVLHLHFFISATL